MLTLSLAVVHLLFPPQMNELGGLRVHAVLRSCVGSLSALRGHGGVRPALARLHQLAALWTLERLHPDVYELRFPRPLLPLLDVKAALRARVDFVPSAVDAITAERLKCVKQP